MSVNREEPILSDDFLRYIFFIYTISDEVGKYIEEIILELKDEIPYDYEDKFFTVDYHLERLKDYKTKEKILSLPVIKEILGDTQVINELYKLFIKYRLINPENDRNTSVERPPNRNEIDEFLSVNSLLEELKKVEFIAENAVIIAKYETYIKNYKNKFANYLINGFSDSIELDLYSRTLNELLQLKKKALEKNIIRLQIGINNFYKELQRTRNRVDAYEKEIPQLETEKLKAEETLTLKKKEIAKLNRDLVVAREFIPGKPRDKITIERIINEIERLEAELNMSESSINIYANRLALINAHKEIKQGMERTVWDYRTKIYKEIKKLLNEYDAPEYEPYRDFIKFIREAPKDLPITVLAAKLSEAIEAVAKKSKITSSLYSSELSLSASLPYSLYIETYINPKETEFWNKIDKVIARRIKFEKELEKELNKPLKPKEESESDPYSDNPYAANYRYEAEGLQRWARAKPEEKARIAQEMAQARAIQEKQARAYAEEQARAYAEEQAREERRNSRASAFRRVSNQGQLPRVDEDYQSKYLKYKTKYFQLKNTLN